MRIDRATRARALMEFEVSYRVHGVCAGIDEVGRGPLAGCVLAACVVMPEEPLLQWVDDSKKLSEKRREKVYQEILDIALFVGIGRAEPKEIDEMNIRNATRLAMQRAETFALTLGPLVNVIATITRPVIWFLGFSTNIAVRLLGGVPKASREEVTDEELRAMVSSSATLGDEERQIVDEVFAAGQVTLREAMVPRTEVDFLDGDMPAHKAIRLIADGAHSRYPVVGRDVDEVLGFLHMRDLFDLDPAARQAPVSQLVRPINSLPGTVRILHALSVMQAAGDHMVIVRDEYGGTAGIVTIEDLVEELIGDITDEFDLEDPDGATGGADELDGLTTLEQFAERFDLVLPEGPYDTVAGYVMAELGSLPQLGDAVARALPPAGEGADTPQEVEFTVTELDGRRASRLRLARLGAGATGEPIQ